MVWFKNALKRLKKSQLKTYLLNNTFDMCQFNSSIITPKHSVLCTISSVWSSICSHWQFYFTTHCTWLFCSARLCAWTTMVYCLHLPCPWYHMQHNLNYHVYADDTQLYLSFNSSQQHANSAIATLELCINEIRQWMKSNFLKLNDEKTEFMLFGSHQQLSKISIDCIHIDDSSIASASQAQNLGAIFWFFHDHETTHLQCHPLFSISTTKHQQDSQIP